ncbi:MAG: hypothetical protein JXB47_11015 [Anaerolineae bacterium]|nr:hypothetical protein [Anaerolineae bacterium]
MRHKVLFLGLALGLVAVLAFTAAPDTGMAAPPAAPHPIPATCTATMIGVLEECTEPWQPGFWDSPIVININITQIRLSVNFGPGFLYVFDDGDDGNKIEIKGGKVEIKGDDFKLEIKDGKVELKTGDLKLKIKAGHIPHGKAWGWWSKHTGAYRVLGWTWIYNGELIFQVPEGADDDPDLLDYKEFRKMVLANYLTTLEFAHEFDELIGGEFKTFDVGDGYKEWGYWSPTSGYLLLGWIKVEGVKLVYATDGGIPISEESFMQYLEEKLGISMKEMTGVQ